MTRFSCYNCSTTYLQYFDTCVTCGQGGTLLPVPEKEKIIFERPNREGCKGLAELRKRTLEGRYLKGFETLGRLPKHNWQALVYGEKGSGKSTFCLLLANVYDGGVLYASFEESMSEAFLQRIQRLELTNDRIVVSDCKSLRELKNDLTLEGSKIDLVILDSISVLGGEIPDLPFGYAQILICHSLKSGQDYKGGSELGHLCDLVIRCENGVAYPEKNRFNKIGESIPIWGENLDAEDNLPILSE